MRNMGFLLLVVIASAMTMPLPAEGQVAAAPARIVPQGELKTVEPALGGTLFFSREQRSQMDRNRDRSPTLVGDLEVIDLSRPTINGFVKRSDGVSAIWLDGTPRSLQDEKVVSRVQPGSVGMDIASVIADAPAEKLAPPERLRDKKPVKKRKAKPLPRPAASQPSK